MKTIALVPVVIPDANFASKQEVEDYIALLKEQINKVESEIRDWFYITEPQKLCPDQNVTSWISSSYEELIEELEDNISLLTKATLLLNAWSDMFHDNGGAKTYTGSLSEGARISSDYILYTNEDGSMAYPDDEIQRRIYEQHMAIINKRKNE